MELQQILSKMEADGWQIADDFKKVHGHFLQYFLETVEEELRQPLVVGRSEQLPCPHCGQLEPCAGNSPETCYHPPITLKINTVKDYENGTFENSTRP